MWPLDRKAAHNHKGYVEGITFFSPVKKKRNNRRLDFGRAFFLVRGTINCHAIFRIYKFPQRWLVPQPLDMDSFLRQNNLFSFSALRQTFRQLCEYLKLGWTPNSKQKIKNYKNDGTLLHSLRPILYILTVVAFIVTTDDHILAHAQQWYEADSSSGCTSGTADRRCQVLVPARLHLKL